MLKLPEDIRKLLIRQFQRKHRSWLSPHNDQENWPLEIALGVPSEQEAVSQKDSVLTWITAWQQWRGSGELIWCHRKWRTLGTQYLPQKLILDCPNKVALWIGESARWKRATDRFSLLIAEWPTLLEQLPHYFDVLADYNENDFQRLCDTVNWFLLHPDSQLYPRQLPISGLDSKWLESRKTLIQQWLAAIQPMAVLGLKEPPRLIRMRILDPHLRTHMGGLGDITAPWEELATLVLPITHVFIVENQQTGLAFPDLAGSVLFMGLGYGVDILARIPWIAETQHIYWGDLDTHGFAILNRARNYLPNLHSILMDEKTLLQHQALWVYEKKQVAAPSLALLTQEEQSVYQGLRHDRWGKSIRLEQERIEWEYALSNAWPSYAGS